MLPREDGTAHGCSGRTELAGKQWGPRKDTALSPQTGILLKQETGPRAHLVFFSPALLIILIDVVPGVVLRQKQGLFFHRLPPDKEQQQKQQDWKAEEARKAPSGASNASSCSSGPLARGSSQGDPCLPAAAQSLLGLSCKCMHIFF